MKEDFNKNIDHTPYLVKLPDKGWTPEHILEEATNYTEFGKYGLNDAENSILYTRWEEKYI